MNSIIRVGVGIRSAIGISDFSLTDFNCDPDADSSPDQSGPDSTDMLDKK